MRAAGPGESKHNWTAYVRERGSDERSGAQVQTVQFHVEKDLVISHAKHGLSVVHKKPFELKRWVQMRKAVAAAVAVAGEAGAAEGAREEASATFACNNIIWRPL